MDKADKIAFGIILGATLGIISFAAYSMFNAHKPPEKPKYEVGECYVYKDKWLKLTIRGEYGSLVEELKTKNIGYITHKGIKDSERFDCDLMEIVLK